MQCLSFPTAAYALLTAAWLAFSFASLHDFFAQYRAAAAALGDLQARGIPAEQTDAGFAWNGWLHRGPIHHAHLQPRASRQIWYLARVFPALRDDYVLSLSPEPPRPVLGRRRYATWLPRPGAERAIWILGPEPPGSGAGSPR